MSINQTGRYFVPSDSFKFNRQRIHVLSVIRKSHLIFQGQSQAIHTLKNFVIRPKGNLIHIFKEKRI